MNCDAEEPGNGSSTAGIGGVHTFSPVCTHGRRRVSRPTLEPRSTRTPNARALQNAPRVPKQIDLGRPAYTRVKRPVSRIRRTVGQIGTCILHYSVITPNGPSFFLCLLAKRTERQLSNAGDRDQVARLTQRHCFTRLIMPSVRSRLGNWPLSLGSAVARTQREDTAKLL